MYREAENNIKPSVPFIELGDCALSTSLGSNWYKTTWGEEYFCTADFTYQSDGSILVNTTGLYLIQAEMTCSTSAAGSFIIRLYDADGQITDSYSKAYLTSSSDVNTLVVSKTAYLQAGDEISVRFYKSTAGIAITGDDYSRFRISYIPSGGWNNNAGGNIINRGIRR